MTKEKFIDETTSTLKSIQLYCDHNHKDKIKIYGNKNLFYKDEDLGNLQFNLCNECKEIFFYSYDRLVKCKHEIKLRCKNCAIPCYSRNIYSQLITIIKYSE